jgi:hypothetical protein
MGDSPGTVLIVYCIVPDDDTVLELSCFGMYCAHLSRLSRRQVPGLRDHCGTGKKEPATPTLLRYQRQEMLACSLTWLGSIVSALWLKGNVVAAQPPNRPTSNPWQPQS